jgi:hypothetical protein
MSTASAKTATTAKMSAASATGVAATVLRERGLRQQHESRDQSSARDLNQKRTAWSRARHFRTLGDSI